MDMDVDDIILVPPTEQHQKAVMEYKQEFIVHDETLHGAAGLEADITYDAWLENIRNGLHPNLVPDGRVVASEFLAIRQLDQRLVGMINVRHELNDYLLRLGGHIGYSVRQSERRKGYASQMLGQALIYCQSLGLQKVLLTCDKTNVGSATVITSNGGVLENEVQSDGDTVQRYWITLPR